MNFENSVSTRIQAYHEKVTRYKKRHLKKNQAVLLFLSGMNVAIGLSSGIVSSRLHVDNGRDPDQLQMY